MLWTVVFAVCLSAQHLVLVCFKFFRIPNPQFVAVCLAMYLVILVPIRIIWGAERGAGIAILGTFFILALAVETDLVGSGYGIADAVFVLIPVFVIGLFLRRIRFRVCSYTRSRRRLGRQPIPKEAVARSMNGNGKIKGV